MFYDDYLRYQCWKRNLQTTVLTLLVMGVCVAFVWAVLEALIS